MPKLPALTPLYRHAETRRMVVVPFHKKDLPKGTLLEILRQAGFSREEIEGAR
jgi:hypothetical protein